MCRYRSNFHELFLSSQEFYLSIYFLSGVHLLYTENLNKHYSWSYDYICQIIRFFCTRNVAIKKIETKNKALFEQALTEEDVMGLWAVDCKLLVG